MEKKYDLISFGEAMIRFNAPDHARLEQSSYLQMAIAAAELNVAVNTSKLGLKTAWFSKLVETWSGNYIINKGREHGVDMSGVILIPFDGMGRVRNGLCFLEIGIGPRASKQIYDRGHSAISLIKYGDIEWGKVLSQTKWFHTTGITTAISDNAANEAIEALKTAFPDHVSTSFDLNFRSTLWSSEKAKGVMKKVMPFIDVIIGNEEDFEKMLGIKAEGVAGSYSGLNAESYRAVAEKVVKSYPDVQVVGTTLRDVKTALLNNWQTVMLHKGEFYVSKKYENLEILDRTGGGDSFASALICSIIEDRAPQEAIEFSAAYSALCHGFLGDWNWATRAEAESVMKGESARVKR
ncbi:MAG: sugar kinase [Actinobacteria bacterium]|nr:sugar kinase [Actinomycetota bacterium]